MAMPFSQALKAMFYLPSQDIAPSLPGSLPTHNDPTFTAPGRRFSSLDSYSPSTLPHLPSASLTNSNTSTEPLPASDCPPAERLQSDGLISQPAYFPYVTSPLYGTRQRHGRDLTGGMDEAGFGAGLTPGTVVHLKPVGGADILTQQDSIYARSIELQAKYARMLERLKEYDKENSILTEKLGQAERSIDSMANVLADVTALTSDQAPDTSQILRKYQSLLLPSPEDTGIYPTTDEYPVTGAKDISLSTPTTPRRRITQRVRSRSTGRRRSGSSSRSTSISRKSSPSTTPRRKGDTDKRSTRHLAQTPQGAALNSSLQQSSLVSRLLVDLEKEKAALQRRIDALLIQARSDPLHSWSHGEDLKLLLRTLQAKRDSIVRLHAIQDENDRTISILSTESKLGTKASGWARRRTKSARAASRARAARAQRSASAALSTRTPTWSRHLRCIEEPTPQPFRARPSPFSPKS
ncbi:hypothetical protein GMRT_11454 [Giardia muris]|uniref:Uncharacterized protein n=1 Tax=Giardia muris TaxID=5742 RepID=A0A4Z1T273_GIAMU|nr:hypothetical protein GMRT_11454 [Giardia muris]|eukprot:TNJ29758.1 hypothetical protein GMRT_11454 [Giardia muris]